MREIQLLKRLLLILLLFVGVYVFLVNYERDESGQSVKDQIVPVIDIHVGDIRALALKNAGGTFGLLAGEKGRVTLEPNPQGVSYSLAEMQGYIYMISKITSVRVIGSVENAGDFGFDSPEAVLTIIRADGIKERYLLGRESAQGEYHYLRREGNEEVYVISAESSRLFFRKSADFVEKEIIPRFGVEDINRLSRLEVGARNRPGREYVAESTGGYNYALRRPVENTLSMQRFFADVILPVATLYPDKIASDNYQGVFEDGYDYRLGLNIDQKDYELVFLKKDDDTYFVMNTADKQVFEIPAERVAFLGKDYLELLSGAIYSSNISNIDSIILDNIAEDDNQTLYISGTADQVKGEIGGKQIEYKTLMEFINRLNSISMAEESAADPAIDSESYLTITVNKKDGSRDYIEFIRAGEGKSYFRVNGVTNFRVYDTVAAEIAAMLDRIVSGDKM